MQSKKTTLTPGVRVPEEFANKYELALQHYGPSHAGFIRAAMTALIHHHANRERVILPLDLRIERTWECPNCHHQFPNVDR